MQGCDRRASSGQPGGLCGNCKDIHPFVAGYVLPNAASEALHRRFGFKVVGVFSENGRKFGKYWDVCWAERAA